MGEGIVFEDLDSSISKEKMFDAPEISLQNPEPLFLKMYPLQLNALFQFPDGQ